LRVGDDLSARRVAQGRPPNPMGIVIAGTDPVPADGQWFSGDERRILVVGRDNPLTEVRAGTELLRAPDERPAPEWVLAQLAQRGVSSFLLEGGPHINAGFLDDGLIDQVYWTVGAHLLGTDALSMIAPIPGGSRYEREPRRGSLVSVIRHEDELFLRYRFDADG
jgi:riboflavin biosynthesis pyrimidine reductase